MRAQSLRFLLCVLCMLHVELSFADDKADEVAQIDAAVTRAVRFLASKQSPDGAWRSDVYAPFKEGDALTPLVMTALLSLAIDSDTREPCERGMKYLVELSQCTLGRSDGLKSLAYPVYTAANTTIALYQNHRLEDKAIGTKWVQVLRDLQLTEATGWSEQDLQFGGWGYGHAAPKKPEQGQPLGPLEEPNLSATRFAIVALHVAGVTNRDPAMLRARRFVEGLQNFDSGLSRHNPRGWNDNGFFFVHCDEVRNKAGKAGVDTDDQPRFVSYGAPTADGLRCLLICAEGLNYDYSRVHYAKQWLEINFLAGEHPGKYPADRVAAKNALYFYYAASLTQAICQMERREWIANDDLIRCVRLLETDLIKRQRAEGSWYNDAVDQREDDPILATTFALQALNACREILSAASGPQ
jgi:hypothetical protein